MIVFGCCQGAAYYRSVAEQAACGTLRQHDVALLVETVGAVALHKWKIEH